MRSYTDSPQEMANDSSIGHSITYLEAPTQCPVPRLQTRRDSCQQERSTGKGIERLSVWGKCCPAWHHAQHPGQEIDEMWMLDLVVLEGCLSQGGMSRRCFLLLEIGRPRAHVMAKEPKQKWQPTGAESRVLWGNLQDSM